MRYRRTDVVERALGVLDQYGLADLSMRRIAAELGVQPSALYHHFANKQALLAAVADEILKRGSRDSEPAGDWDQRVLDQCRGLRDAMLAYRDGAELISTVHAFGLGVQAPRSDLADTLRRAGFEQSFSHAAATTILHFVFGHVSYEQLSLQAKSDGAIEGDIDLADAADAFTLGLALIVDGIGLRQPSYER